MKRYWSPLRHIDRARGERTSRQPQQSVRESLGDAGLSCLVFLLADLYFIFTDMRNMQRAGPSLAVCYQGIL